MLKNKFALLLAPVLIMGCATAPEPAVKVVIQRVEVPVEIPCKAVMPATPGLNFGSLSPEQDIFEKVRALLADRQLSIAHSAELAAALNSCIK